MRQHKNFLIGIAITGVLLAGTEAALRAFSPWAALSSEIKSRHSPKAGSITLTPYVQSAIAEFAAENLENNPVLIPSRRYLYRGAPNPLHKEIYCHDEINEEGFRGLLFAGVRAKKRVLVVGDSCGYGFGICTYQRSWAPLLEKALSGASVLNLSQPGYSTTQAALLFADRGAELKPDLVVLYLGWNDLWPSRGLTDAQILRLSSSLQDPPFSWLKKTELYRHVEYLLLSGQTRKETHRVPDEEALQNFRGMIAFGQSLGAHTLLVLPPFSERAPKLKLFMPQYRELLRAAFSGAAGVTLVDTQSVMNKEPGAFLDDGFHPSAKGSALLANALAPIAAEKLKSK